MMSEKRIPAGRRPHFRVWDSEQPCQGFLSLWELRGRFHKVQVKLLPQNKIITFQDSMRVLALLRKLALTPETVLVIRGNHLLTEDELIQADDEIEIRSVI